MRRRTGVRDALRTTLRQQPTLLFMSAIFSSEEVGLDPPHPRSCLCNLVELILEGQSQG
jgi:hypothetical protein